MTQRKKYDNSHRAEQKLLRDLQRTLRVRFKDAGRPRSERRKDAREKLLPANRVCPVCEKVVTRSKAWVIRVDQSAVCKSCFMLGAK